MSINESFYKNVFLLTKVVPTSYEFQKYFRQGMFDRPNTQGFIHVSHYLLSVYNKKQFKRMVLWPIICKADERQFRTDIKEYLVILSKENPDIDFPPILISNLLQAGGTKFSIVMWKLSEIALRAYIEREYQTKLLSAPKSGCCNQLTVMNLCNSIRKRNVVTSKLYEELQESSFNITEVINGISNNSKITRDEIFKKKDDIEKCIILSPINSIVAKRLTNINDLDIVDLWRFNIKKQLQYLIDANEVLNHLEAGIKRVYSLVLNLSANSNVLDANQLKKMMIIRDDTQHLTHGLYLDGLLNLQNFFWLFDTALKNLMHHLNLINLPDLTKFELHMTECNKRLKSDQIGITELKERALSILNELKYNFEEQDINNTDLVYPVYMNNILLSPTIKFSLDEFVEDPKLFTEFFHSPLKDNWKKLFKRHKLDHSNLLDQSVINILVDNSMEISRISCKSPKLSINCNSTPPNRRSAISNVSPRYSGLLYVKSSRRKYLYDENASTPKRLRSSITPVKIEKVSNVNFNSAAKNLFNLSGDSFM